MHYIKLADNSLILTTSSGPITLTPQSLNYPLIVKALSNDTPDDVILSLIHEATPDGLYYAYENNGQLAIKHIDLKYQVSWSTTNPDKLPVLSPTIDYLGTYASRESLIAAHPEYFI